MSGDRHGEASAVRRLALPSGIGMWLVTGHAEARMALSDQRFAKDARKMARLLGARAPGTYEGLFGEALARHLLNTDPPEHWRLRKLVNKAFTPQRVQRLRPRVEQITRELLDAVRGQDVVDLIGALAVPLPIAVICELLGVPQEDRAAFRAWSNAVVRAPAPRPAGGADPADTGHTADTGAGAVAAMDRFLRDLVAAKRAQPGDDLVSALVAEEGGSGLTEQEAAAMAGLLLAAGHETTVNLIGNGALALLTHPRQLAELRADRTLLPRAIEEFLRYDGPVNQATLRFTAEPVHVGGVRIPRDEFVMVNVDAANHDPDRYPEPDRFDLHRDAGGHLSFGHGIHYCLGAPLARLEAAVAFEALLDRFDPLELAVPAHELEWHTSTLMRGLVRLPARVVPSAGPTARGRAHGRT